MINYKIEKLAAYYCDEFYKIADVPIWEKATIRGSKLSQRVIQQAYKEMRNIKFRGDIIEYLCYICLNLKQMIIYQRYFHQ